MGIGVLVPKPGQHRLYYCCVGRRACLVRGGFPNLRKEDPELSLAMPGSDPYPQAEERRLFYVALTRARRSVAMFTVRGRVSPFLDELVGDGLVEMTDTAGEPVNETKCPECGIGVLITKPGRYGPFVGCSNYPDCRFKPPQPRSRTR